MSGSVGLLSQLLWEAKPGGLRLQGFPGLASLMLADNLMRLYLKIGSRVVARAGWLALHVGGSRFSIHYLREK